MIVYLVLLLLIWNPIIKNKEITYLIEIIIWNCIIISIR